MMEPPLRKIISDVCAKACDHWPEMIQNSGLTPKQKDTLIRYILTRPVMVGYLKRARQDADALIARATGGAEPETETEEST